MPLKSLVLFSYQLQQVVNSHLASQKILFMILIPIAATNYVCHPIAFSVSSTIEERTFAIATQIAKRIKSFFSFSWFFLCCIHSLLPLTQHWDDLLCIEYLRYSTIQNIGLLSSATVRYRALPEPDFFFCSLPTSFRPFALNKNQINPKYKKIIETQKY